MPRLCCLALALAATAARANPPPGLSPEDGVVLLTNGQALRGKVTRAGDYYFVTLEAGEIRLKAAEVELFCHDLEDGYRLKRSVIIPGQVEDHLGLAAWCIRHELLEHAVAELAAARKADPTHPKIPLLERRVQLAKAPPADAPAAATARSDAPSNVDLDRLARGLPAAVVEQFTNSIQPLLLNHCATGGCHGPGSPSDYNLLRVSGKSNTRHTKLRNLYNTLRFIDPHNPADSPLLTAPIREHGTTKAAIFTQRDMPQYQQLVVWANRIAASLGTAGQPPQAASVARGSETLFQSPWARPAQTAPLPTATPAGTDPKAAQAPAPDARSPAPLEPADPFDPEVFNRRFLAPD